MEAAKHKLLQVSCAFQVVDLYPGKTSRKIFKFTLLMVDIQVSTQPNKYHRDKGDEAEKEPGLKKLEYREV